MNGMDLTQFVLGFAVGGFVMWQMSKVVERFRRARRDFQAARSGVRTLIEMTFKRGADAMRWLVVGVGAVATVVIAWIHNHG
jgi:hypothetical protein